MEAHLELERAALTAERRAAQRSAPNERWMLIRAAGLGLALAGTIAFGWSQLNRSDPAKFCTADGYVTQSGETLSRNADCAWVDSDGKPVPVDADGTPTG